MRKYFSLVLAFALLFATGCDRHEKPESVVPQEQGRRSFFGEYELEFPYSLWLRPTIDDDQLTGPGWNFTEPWNHRAEYNLNQRIEAFQIPEEILAVMSTRNLARTCYIYSYNIEYRTFTDEYYGLYTVLGRLNGWTELMQRESGIDELIHLLHELEFPAALDTSMEAALNPPLDYTEYPNPNYAYQHIRTLMYVIATAVDYERLSAEQIINLIDEVVIKLEDLLSKPELYGDYYADYFRFPYVLGAFIAWHYDSELSSSDLVVLENYLDEYSIENVIHYPGIPVRLYKDLYYEPDSEAINKAIEIIGRSLDRLYNSKGK